MIVMELHCPTCHSVSGNAVTVDWPCPLEARSYPLLICQECGREFSFGVDRDNGMRSWATHKTTHLADFLERRRKQLKAGQ